jgi:hypothetical protein
MREYVKMSNIVGKHTDPKILRTSRPPGIPAIQRSGLRAGRRPLSGLGVVAQGEPAGPPPPVNSRWPARVRGGRGRVRRRWSAERRAAVDSLGQRSDVEARLSRASSDGASVAPALLVTLRPLD